MSYFFYLLNFSVPVTFKLCRYHHLLSVKGLNDAEQYLQEQSASVVPQRKVNPVPGNTPSHLKRKILEVEKPSVPPPVPRRPLSVPIGAKLPSPPAQEEEEEDDEDDDDERPTVSDESDSDDSGPAKSPHHISVIK